jgi:hypothetical protein
VAIGVAGELACVRIISIDAVLQDAWNRYATHI